MTAGPTEGGAIVSSRRVVLERSWIFGVVVFTVARFFVAYGALDRFGVNVWAFGAVDLVTAVPYGLSTARVVGSLVDRRLQSAVRWGALASFCFLAPYLYIAWAGQDVGLPTVVYVVLAALVVCFGLNAVLGIKRRVHRSRFVDAGAGS